VSIHEERGPRPDGVEIAGERFVLDEELNQILREGVPAVLEPCRHTRQVIKQDELFLVTDVDGGVYHRCNCGTGLYHKDTRFLNGWELRLEGITPTLLSTSTERNFLSRIEFMNGQMTLRDGTQVPQESLYIASHRLIRDYVHERLEIVNYNAFPVTIRLSFFASADFSDMFEVRGAYRGDRGRFFLPKLGERDVVLSYQGADRLFRRTRLRFSESPVAARPTSLAHGTAVTLDFEIHVAGGGGRASLETTVEPLLEGEPEPPGIRPFPDMSAWLEAEQKRRKQGYTRLSSDNEIYNLVLERSVLDIEALSSVQPETGAYIVAGIPWFACPFGRDALIAAFQSLVLGPELAKGTLRYLARYQGKDVNDYRDEEPGKIMHEIRYGELTNLGQVPHSPYYGSIDATPLYLILIHETYRWTGDLDFVREMWESVEQALMWIDAYGDQDGDGFLEYATKSPLGLFNQCWKDSTISNVNPDFTIAQPPIAVAEVQAYVYDAKRRMAELCYALDLRVMGDRLVREAEDLKVAFNKAFWSEADGFYVIALDRDKQQVRTLASNIGHGLWCGIVEEARIPLVARQMMAPDMFSGWGIRTLSASMPPYNPLSYHNGSIWPHDNSLIAKGLADSGYSEEALQVMNALYDAALQFPYYRLPELFCGFPRSGDMDKPVPYPVACAPQAWAAGATLLLLQSILGLNPDAARHQLLIRRPVLPPWLENVYLRGLRIGDCTVDLQFMQTNGVTTARVLAKQGGPLKILIEG
jgi:glycogen debranching enzyme